MNALLIYPAFPDTFWSFKHALKFIHKKSAYPPLGLLTVGAMLPEKWSKRLVDLNVAKLTQKDLKWADCAVISAMAIQRESSNQIITICKDAGLRVIAGGPLFTNEYDQFETVDHIVMNEAELTLPSFLADLEGDCAKHVYGTSEFADIRKTPTPMWKLIDLKKYASMNIQFSRGCPFYCDFCNVTALFGHQLRHKTSAQIIAELDKLYNLGWRGQVFFVDDNFVKMDFQRLLAFFRSCVIIGIFGKERFQFWGLFFWTLFRCPRFVPLTIAFAIYGYHFRRICKL